MKRILGLVSLQIIVVLCALIVFYAYRMSKDLGAIGAIAAQRHAASNTQAAVKQVAFELQAMETSQRGYLVTGDASYLKAYGEANSGLAARFNDLRSRLSGPDRQVETQLESVAAAKIDEMNETIAARQKGYRHRAFLIEESNRGPLLRDEADKALAALSSGQSGTVVRHDSELREVLSKAAKQSALANALLLAIAVAAFLAFHRYRRGLETAHRRQEEQLRAARAQVERLNSILFDDFGVRLTEMESDAGLLLDTYGGYLPRQAHERVERIRSGTGQMISMVGELSQKVSPEKPNSVAVRQVQSRSA